MLPDKAIFVATLRAQLSAELEAVERVAAMARDEVSSDQTKQEGQYDTRATEASYLARGQAWRIEELRRIVGWFGHFDPSATYDRVAIGALVAVETERTELLFLAPVGGARVEVEGAVVRVISPSSPLGQALMGLEPGESSEMDSPRGMVDVEVLEVR